MSRREREGFFWIFLAAAGFSTMPSMVKIAYAQSPLAPLDIAIWRFLLAVPLMWGLIFLARRRARPAVSALPRRRLLPIGLILCAAVLASFFALQRLPGSIFIVLFFTYPAMVAALSALLGEKLPPRLWLALAMALAGVALTVPDLLTGGEASAIDPLGVALVLLNAAIVAVYYLLARRALKGVADVSGASGWMMLGALCFFLLLIPLRGLQLPPNGLTLLMLLGIATLGTVLPIFATNVAIQRIGAARTSLASTIEPILSMLVSMVILGEVVLGLQWLGAALIVGSVLFLQLRPRHRVDLSMAQEAA